MVQDRTIVTMGDDVQWAPKDASCLQQSAND